MNQSTPTPTETELINSLIEYNNSIENSDDSRGFGHWCAVGTADILGAYRLGKLGASNVETIDSVEEENTTDKIVNLYVAGLKKAESKLHTVEKITNDYIEIIEKSYFINEEERTILYSAFAVADYSCKYWTETEVNGYKTF